MYDLEVICKDKQDDLVLMSELQAGQVAVVVSGVGNYIGHYVLFDGSHVTDLTNPFYGGWSSLRGNTLRCRVLPPGEQLVLTVRN